MAPSLDDLVQGIRRIPVEAARTWEDIQGKWQSAIHDVRMKNRLGNFIGNINGSSHGNGNGNGNSSGNGNINGQGNGVGTGNGNVIGIGNGNSNGNGIGNSYGNVNGNSDGHGNALNIEILTGSSETGTEHQKKTKKKVPSSGKSRKGKSPHKGRGKGRVSSVDEASGRDGMEAAFLEREEGERGGRGEGGERGMRDVDGEERGEQFRVSNGANPSMDWEEVRANQERKGNFSMGPPFAGMEVDRYEGDEWMVGGEEEREREDSLAMTPLPREVDENDSWDQSQLAVALLKQPPLNEGPVDRQQLGRATWTFLHTLAAQYPENPTRQQQKDVKELMHILTRIYPCSICAEHFKEVIRNNPPVSSSNHELSQWMCRIHNVVNRSLDKPLFPCERVDNRWGQLECDQNACTMEGKK